MLFVELYLFSLNQVGTGFLRYSGSGFFLFFNPVCGCKRYVRFLPTSCVCPWVHQEAQSLKKPKTLGVYMEYRVAHNEESKVKTEVSKQHLALLARHGFFCIGIWLSNIHCSTAFMFLLWIRSIHVPHIYGEATGRGGGYLYIFVFIDLLCRNKNCLLQSASVQLRKPSKLLFYVLVDNHF